MFKFFVLTFLYLLGFLVSLNAQNVYSNKELEFANEVKSIIKQILEDEKNYDKLDKIILKSNEKINKKQILLDELNQKKYILDNELNNLQTEQNNAELTMAALIVKKYSKSLAIKYAKKKSPKSIIDNKVYNILHTSITNEVSKYNKISKILKDKISLESSLILKLNVARKEQEKLISVNQKLKREQRRSLNVLRGKHNFYVKKLEELKRAEKKSKEFVDDSSPDKSSDNKSHSNEFKYVVNDISNKFNSIFVSNYNGLNTIPPFKNYTITDKFGKYYDTVYKAELFNSSISLETKKKNIGVKSILDGEIIFVKKDSVQLKHIVTVQHTNGLKTIYSNLKQISSKIYAGKMISKGTTLGRIDNKLILQATQNNRYIDPLKLFVSK